MDYIKTIFCRRNCRIICPIVNAIALIGLYFLAKYEYLPQTAVFGYFFIIAAAYLGGLWPGLISAGMYAVFADCTWV